MRIERVLESFSAVRFSLSGFYTALCKPFPMTDITLNQQPVRRFDFSRMRDILFHPR